MNCTDQLYKAKEASRSMCLLDSEQINQVLQQLAKSLRDAKDTIIKENEKDLARMSEYDPKYDRLLLTTERIEGIARDIENTYNYHLHWEKYYLKRHLTTSLKLKK